MKVLIVTAGMAGGGTERVISVLSRYLIENGNQVTIILTSDGRVEYELHKEILIRQLGEKTNGKFLKRVGRIFALRRVIKSNKKQIVVSFGTETNLFTILATRFLPNKVIVSERNDPNQCTYPKFRNFIYQFADRFIFQTKEAQDCFPQKIAKRGIVIPNPLKSGLPNGSTEPRNKKIVAVGRLEKQKNYKLLLDSFERFHKRHAEYQLVIFGKGELLKELQEMTIEKEIQEFVCFAGFSSNVQKELINAAMYVLSSDFEGISNSLMEAMAMGVPSISTDCPIGGSALLIENNINGMLVPVGDSKAFSEAMCKIVEDENFAKQLSENATTIAQKYSEQKICDMWMQNILNSI
ncbi:MAG: glycosyltransferase family 4 protein [Lachnospiraceae bacterium]|nr:glycosyltransferase family 4 protein [Lachnospiraceae bacterium]